MLEDSFEIQVHKLMENFKLTPPAVVWIKVKQKISKNKRRRRWFGLILIFSGLTISGYLLNKIQLTSSSEAFKQNKDISNNISNNNGVYIKRNHDDSVRKFQTKSQRLANTLEKKGRLSLEENNKQKNSDSIQEKTTFQNTSSSTHSSGENKPEALNDTSVLNKNSFVVNKLDSAFIDSVTSRDSVRKIFSDTLYSEGLTTITGSIRDSKTQEFISYVSVTIKGSKEGAFTDNKGNFKLTTKQKLPLVLVINAMSFTPKEIKFVGSHQPLNIELEESYVLGQDIVVSPSRLPERILSAPVSVESINSKTIISSPAPSYYDLLGNLKGVDVNTSSYTFKTPSTRGFNYSGNTRFNQFVDGMDNSAPALNFSVGNIIGLTELDVDNMELLPGASSALYGSGGLNGTLLINSKNPFKYQGLSFQIKQGMMHVNDPRHPISPFYDWSVRWGKKISDKFAFKIGAEYVKANDWEADDSTDLLRNNVNSKVIPGTRQTDPNYDGVNIYGDEVTANMKSFSQLVSFQIPNDAQTLLNSLLAQGYSYNAINSIVASNVPALSPYVPFYLAYAGPAFGRPDIYDTSSVSRTGYPEKSLADYNTYNFKLSGGLYYNITRNIQASLTANWGKGTSVYTGADRYSLKNFYIGQYKLEFKSKNWFLRGYTTQENSGDSYAQTLAAIGINNAWKDDATWFQQYIGAYSAYALATGDLDVAHQIARNLAESGRFLPGTQEFNDAFNKSITTPISQNGVAKGGSQFADKSSLYEAEGQLDLSRYVKVMNVLVGANYRLYNLNSKGTIFADTAGPIKIHEYGTYLQLQKQLFNEVLRLSVSGRIDKQMNYDAQFTPRATASVKVTKDNFVRFSYQQAYRFPTNQDQYINIQTPGSVQIGGLESFAQFFHFDTNPVYTSESVAAYQAAGGYFGDSVTHNLQLLKVAQFVPVKPESVKTFELGYRGIVAQNLLVDAYVYTSKYKDFIGREAVARGATNSPDTSVVYLSNPLFSVYYSFVVNSPTPVKETGWGIGLEYQTRKGYRITGNASSDQLHNVPESLVTFFNTPKYRYNIGLANSNLYKGFGFNVIYKWQDKTYWEGTFGTSWIPSYGTIDLMLSYKIGKSKNLIKLGATNLFNNYYRTAFGNPYVGGLYYISFGYNVF